MLPRPGMLLPDYRRFLRTGCLRWSWFVLAMWALNPALAQEVPKITGSYQIEKGTRQGWLIVTVDVPAGCHIYALTQKGSPPPTKLKLAESDAFEMLDQFAADKAPKVIEHDPVFDQRIEKYDSGRVKFLAPVRFADGIDVETVEFDLKFHGQVCSDSGCKPLFNKPVVTSFAGYYEPPKKQETSGRSP